MSRFFTLSKSGFFAIAIVTNLLSVLHAEQRTESNHDQTTVLIQMSDPQFYFKSSSIKTVDAESDSRAKAAVRYANQLKPDAVVVTGDLIQIPGDKSQTATFWRFFNQLDPSIPLHCMPGNHDVDTTAESLEFYRENFGKDYYSFPIGPDRFLALNSMLLRTETSKTEETDRHWKWIEAELKNAKVDKARHTVIFLHHPIFLKNPDEKEVYFNLPIASRKRLFRLFSQYGVDAVFSGHHHRNSINQYQGIDYIVTSSICVPLDKEPAGFRIIELKPDGITHRYVPVPE